MSIKKQFFKSKDVCKVTWTVKKQVAKDASNISLSGSFNDWDLNSLPLEKTKSGDFKLVMELPKNTQYQFRYLIDGEIWMNDDEADGYVDNHLSNESNCIISL
ncbi:isoamylase early set domain-containing protein [Reichenbachiella agarivorans]|uniref:Isoamylase early set domain-containing protein n=1 Tax=Reichenbachiella agarivorans TaxID=2979464 RepID=A0ABY6CLK2_9BACT|nr:isoamylase early set domain-containing protein [Reichenbachiella agarivorans]UXP30584.1 isoamylase early set domain-containing protein [Reichenbachiella agarivorans]